jgi:hypothetical protein
MGGEISVSSQLGKGTAFDIIIKSKSKVRLSEMQSQMKISNPFMYKPAD